MAERKARHRCETKIIKLKAAADCVSGLAIIQEDERKLDVSHLGCKLNALRTNWDSLRLAMVHSTA